MILVKVNKNGDMIYPYSIEMFKKDNISITFPDVITIELLNEYCVFEVISTSIDIDYRKNYIEDKPILKEDEKFYQK
jgi:hypothetical protein